MSLSLSTIKLPLSCPREICLCSRDVWPVTLTWKPVTNWDIRKKIITVLYMCSREFNIFILIFIHWAAQRLLFWTSAQRHSSPVQPESQCLLLGQNHSMLWLWISLFLGEMFAYPAHKWKGYDHRWQDIACVMDRSRNSCDTDMIMTVLRFVSRAQQGCQHVVRSPGEELKDDYHTQGMGKDERYCIWMYTDETRFNWKKESKNIYCIFVDT